MTLRSVIQGVGAYLPERVVSNAELEKTVDTTDAWIVERTGIRQRHIAAEGELTSDLAIAAAKRALAHAKVDGQELDLIVVATATPDHTFPATAVKVQEAFARPGIPAFDVQAVCTGFVYALAVADNFVRLGQAKTALVIGAETFSRILDWKDRTTCVLFGDGAGAVVLQAKSGKGTAADQGILSSHLHADGRQHDLLYVDGGPSTTGTAGYLRMQGREVFKHAVVNLSDTVKEALAANEISIENVDWFVPHQANKRILDSTAKKLGLAPEKVIVTVDQHANTSAASIPLALNAGVSDGRIKRGDLMILEGMGGGFTWGSVAARY